MDERAARITRNEALFREVNERVRELAARFGGEEHLYEFVCECANTDCTLQVELTVGEYERVRSAGRRFLIALGHELPQFERVVESGPRFSVVEKLGDAGEVAEELDPRSE